MSEDQKQPEAQEEKRASQISIPTPWGPIVVRGLGTILTIGVAGMVLIGSWVWDGKAEHKDITTAVGLVVEQMSEQTYVLSLKPEDREKLNISMPHSLRNKIRRNDQ